MEEKRILRYPTVAAVLFVELLFLYLVIFPSLLASNSVPVARRLATSLNSGYSSDSGKEPVLITPLHLTGNTMATWRYRTMALVGRCNVAVGPLRTAYTQETVFQTYTTRLR